VNQGINEDADERNTLKKQLAAFVIVLSPLTFATTGAFAATKPKPAVTATKAKPPLGDISKFHTITVDTLAFAKAGDMKKAEKRITDMETKWDAYANPLQAKNKAAWTKLDLALDRVLKELRASKPNPATSTTALQDMLTMIDSYS
jgi:hypothetical protein